jgi:hypothetical protein
MNDEFGRLMTRIVPLFLYLDVTLEAEQDRDLAGGPDKHGNVFFSVKGDQEEEQFMLHIGKAPLNTWYSAKTKKLTGFWEIYSVEGPYQGSMVVAMRPFTPTLKKCVRDTSGPHAYH